MENVELAWTVDVRAVWRCGRLLRPCGTHLWRVNRRHLLPFGQMFFGERGGAWNGVVASGSYKLAINDDPAVFAGYALKQQHMRWADDEIVWSSEFLPHT